MALIGSAPTLRCSCGGTLLVGKDVVVSTVLDESRCGHKTSVGFGIFSWRELFSGIACGCVPGLLRTGNPVVPKVVFSKQLSYLGYKLFAKTFFGNEPLHE
jgi:hypothetical protein